MVHNAILVCKVCYTIYIITSSVITNEFCSTENRYVCPVVKLLTEAEVEEVEKDCSTKPVVRFLTVT